MIVSAVGPVGLGRHAHERRHWYAQPTHCPCGSVVHSGSSRCTRPISRLGPWWGVGRCSWLDGGCCRLAGWCGPRHHIGSAQGPRGALPRREGVQMFAACRLARPRPGLLVGAAGPTRQPGWCVARRHQWHGPHHHVTMARRRRVTAMDPPAEHSGTSRSRMHWLVRPTSPTTTRLGRDAPCSRW